MTFNVVVLVANSCLTLSTAKLLCLCPWDFPGNNSGVGCHFLLQGRSQEYTGIVLRHSQECVWNRESKESDRKG